MLSGRGLLPPAWNSHENFHHRCTLSANCGTERMVGRHRISIRTIHDQGRFRSEGGSQEGLTFFFALYKKGNETFRQRWRGLLPNGHDRRGKKIHQPAGKTRFTHSQGVSWPLSSSLLIGALKHPILDASPTTRHSRVAFLSVGRVR